MLAIPLRYEHPVQLLEDHIALQVCMNDSCIQLSYCRHLNIAAWVNPSMANSMMKVKGIVSIALFLMLAATLVTGFLGNEREGNGLGEGGLHIASAGVLGLLAIAHILLNQRMILSQIKALLGIKNKPKTNSE